MNHADLSALRPEHPTPRAASELAGVFGFTTSGVLDGVSLTGVTIAAEQVLPGDLFAGLRGLRAHGADFAAAAAERGAAAVLTDVDGAERAASAGLPVLVADDPRAVLGDVAAWIHGTADTPVTVFGATGTNGKTSVVHLLAAILEQLGRPAGLSSTAVRRIADTSVTSGLTTPEAPELHGMLARMRELGIDAAALEVSAQAVLRRRIDGIVFDVVGFTNLSHDHLDDFGTMEEYFEAKLALFTPRRARRGVVVRSGPWADRLVERSAIPVVSLALGDEDVADAEWRLHVLHERVDGVDFRLDGPGGRSLQTRVPVLGDYMAVDAALAIVMLVESGVDFAAIADRLAADGGIRVYLPGRAERVSGDRGPVVFVDYAHSPDAFAHTLAAVRRVTTGKVVMLFGADGDRDTTKRAEMGAIAARLADVVVVTDFHPRWEDPESIRMQIIDGARAARPDADIIEIADPRAALRAAIARAGDGDTVLYAGPGHEDYHEVAGVKHPYSARDESRTALREAGWPA